VDDAAPEPGELAALRAAFPGYRIRRRTIRGVPCYLAEARPIAPRAPAESRPAESRPAESRRPAAGPPTPADALLAAEAPLAAARSPAVLAGLLAAAADARCRCGLRPSPPPTVTGS
jgi:hypothetical protein